MAGRPPVSTSWKEGQSGNPAGRPKNAKDIRKVYRAMLDSAAPDIIATAIDLARSGNEQMIRCVLERIEPKKREQTYVTLPGLKGKDYAGKCLIVDQALADEIISSEVWETMHKVFSRCFEVEELDRRLTIIEVKQGIK